MHGRIYRNLFFVGSFVQVKFVKVGMAFENKAAPATGHNNFCEWNYFSWIGHVIFGTQYTITLFPMQRVRK